MIETGMTVLFLLAASQATATASPTPPPAEERLICKRQPITGSLARTKRTCMTKRDWERTGQIMQDFGRGMAETFRTRCGQPDCV